MSMTTKMTSTAKALASVLLCASMVGAGPATAMAQPIVAAPPTFAGTTVTGTYVERVQFRDGRRFRGSGYRRGGNGGNIALGIGGIVMSEAARAEHRSSHGSAWNRCAQTYRSFDSDTGTYTGYDGVQRTCPYLR